MRETLDYTFEVSLSTRTYDHKPNKTTEIPSMRFHKTTTDIGGFADAISDGHCYTTVFPFDEFGMTQKKAVNFSHSNFISIDFDHSAVDMDAFIDSLPYKPTISYTTCSNGIDGEYRYRLLYCFDGRIESIDEYRAYVSSVLEANHIFSDDVDNKSFKAEQFYVGNGTGNVKVSTSNIIYSKEDFKINNNDIILRNNNLYYNINNTSKSINNNHIQDPPYNMNIVDTFVDKQFEEDYWKMSMGDIISKYQSIFPNMEHTPLPTVDDDTPYIQFPNDYIEIRRYWTARNDGRAIKLKDGQGRRRKLFANGVIRRRINPNITFDNLLYNLLYELYYYISNYDAKNIIGKKEIYEIAKNVMDADLSRINIKGTDRKFIVNQNYCIKHDVSKHKVKAQVTKELGLANYKRGEIEKHYNENLTDIENVEMMKAKGFDVSVATLKRWRKEKGITKYKKRKQNKNQ